ncbi:MAG: FAD-dependent oxidoreductase, partial [Candidatus Thermoplasmatota archaeon]
MPKKNYNHKQDHDLGIPLCDDYFYDEPEEIIQEKQILKHKKPKKDVGISDKKKERVINADVLIVGAGISGMQSALDIADKGYKVV